MKIKAKKYAEALFLSLKDKGKEEIGKILDNFINLLNDHNQLALIRKIIFHLENIYQKESLYCSVSIETKHKLSKENKEKIIKFLETKTKGAEIQWQEKINSEILGGFILRYNDKIYDASFKNHLNQFKKEINKK
jgi:F-type H+-transporting ATPase subunit delta